MFKQFQYPSKIPNTPDRIHRLHTKCGKINSAINDADMRPSYQSHKSSKRLSPETLSESEEEVLYRAQEEDWEQISEPPSLDESCYISASEGEQEAGHSMLSPYQLVEELHYRSNQTSRSGSRASSAASNRAREDDRPRHSSKKKSKPKRTKQPSEGELSPLHEEEERPKRKHQKAQAPLPFPKPKKRPSPRSNTRYVTQPILFPVPQPYPMPFPMYSPMNQMYYPPPPAPQSMESPQINPVVQQKRETSTQYTQALPEAVQTEPTAPQSTSAFLDALAEIDKRLSHSKGRLTPEPESKTLRKPVVLGIGLAEGKSLAEHFKEKLPEVSAKLHSRDSSRTPQKHASKSTAQLLEIRKELLRPASANSRLSNASGASDPHIESVSTRSIDPGQLERADRLAAGMSVVPPRKPASDRLISGSETPLSCITEETQDRRGRKLRAPVKIQ